ncbi:MAG: S41 family peptidase [Kofleriaceae bacterium]
MARWLVVVAALCSLGGTPPGPLSTSQRVVEKSWNEQKKVMEQHRQRRLSKQEIIDDVAALAKVIGLYFVPRTEEHRAGVQHLTDLGRLHQLAPYSVDSVLNAFYHPAGRLEYCVRAAGLPRQCDVDFVARSPSTLPPFEVGVLPSKLVRLVVRDLSDGANPAWATLAGELAKVANAPGIIVDMRGAFGGDPRPLLPWLKTITGRPDLAPLREIRRPAQLDPYVAAYDARYLKEGRDRAHWTPLVGPARTGPTVKTPIAVLVGRHCESACELVARVLETYANAIVIGGVGRSGRLDRDEPAMVTLPSSKAEIYFHAAEYLLATDIEAKTGPTNEWWLRRRAEPVDYDGTAIAERELLRQIASPAPVSCAGFVAYKDRKRFPEPLRKKIHASFALEDTHCTPSQRSVHVRAKVSLHTLRRLVESCGGNGAYVGRERDSAFSFSVVVGIELVSKLAQSNLVDEVYVQCSQPPELDD